jgi:nicotinate (nicotinamide) nucleotide adenylyltransferase
MLKLGILGGTFNPVHYGHLLMAERAREALDISKIIFMPTGNPPHKDSKTVATADDRFKMVELAVGDYDNFIMSKLEIDREGKTYTVDTLKQLKAEYGEDTQIFFIIGADVLMDIPKWRSAGEVARLCKFAAIQRAGYNKEEFASQAKHLYEEFGAEIEEVEMPIIEISSTDIRTRISDNLSIKFMLPDNVIKYILEKGLYS